MAVSVLNDLCKIRFSANPRRLECAGAETVTRKNCQQFDKLSGIISVSYQRLSQLFSFGLFATETSASLTKFSR